MEIAHFPLLDKKNTRDKAKGLRIASEGYIKELGARYLSRINRGRTLGNRLIPDYIMPPWRAAGPLPSEGRSAMYF